MPLPTQPVTCQFFDQNGNPVARARVEFTLTAREIYQGIVAPEKVQAVADENGLVVVNLFPNALGVAASQYQVKAWNPDNGKKFLDTHCVVPNSAAQLHDILDEEPYPTIDAAQLALQEAQTALSGATTQAGYAATSAASAGSSATSAASAASSAQSSATSSQESADSSLASKVASESAASAASTASSQAQSYSVAAASSSTDAQGAAAQAAAARDASEAFRNTAEGHSDSAEAHAATALAHRNSAEAFKDSAGVFASSASASAAAGAGSAAAAEGYATAAQSSATAAAASESAASVSASAAATQASAAAASGVYVDSKVSEAELALAQTQAARDAAATYRDTTEGYKNTTQGYMSATEGYRDEANTHRLASESSASNSLAYSQQSATSAASSSASAVSASNSADASLVSANNSSSSASTAATQAGLAESAKTAAEAARDAAVAAQNSAEEIVTGGFATLTPSPGKVPLADSNGKIAAEWLTLGDLAYQDANAIAGDVAISASSSSDALRITQTGAGNALLVEDSANPDSTPFVIDANGAVIKGYSALINADNYNGVQITPNFQIHGGSNQNVSSMSITSWAASASAGLPGTLILARAGTNTVGTDTIVAADNYLGSIVFDGNDGADFIAAASITALVDGTPGTNDMPGRLVFSTTADGASSPTERMRIDSAGNIGIGGVSVAGFKIANYGNVSGATSAYSYYSGSVYQSDVTTNAVGYGTFLGTANSAFTLSALSHHRAAQGTIGASSTVTNQFGFEATSSITGATNNYGFYSNIASGTGRWNFYANGTAQNYFSGTTLVGTTTNTNSSKLVVDGTISETVGGTQYLVVSQYDIGTAPNEIPLNQYLGNLAYQDANAIAGNVGIGGSLTLSSGTANGVAYLDGSKVLTTGSALTFDGTTLTSINNSSANSITLSRTTSVARNWALGVDGDGGFRLTDSTGSVVVLSALPSGVAFLASESELAFKYNSSTEGMRLTSTGLGIGTSSPAAKLDVLGASSDQIRVRTAGTEFYRFGRNSSTGFLDFYGSQTGYQGYTFGGVDGTWMTLNSSGNLGLGVTPSAWGAPTFQVGRTSVYGSGSFTAFGSNWFSDTGDKYIASDYATQYYQLNGQHVWRTAPSGTAGNAISFTQAMTLDASGNLLVGTTSSASAKLRVLGASSGGGTVYIDTNGAFSGTDTSTLGFSVYQDSGVRYNSQAEIKCIGDGNYSGSLAFFTQTAGTYPNAVLERARIDSSGIFQFKYATQETKTAIAASAIDLSTGNYFSKTISGATTFTVSNTAASGLVSAFVLDLTNGGSATVTWWSGVKWNAATPPTLTASGRDVLGFFTYDGGTTWNGFVLGQGMA